MAPRPASITKHTTTKTPKRHGATLTLCAEWVESLGQLGECFPPPSALLSANLVVAGQWPDQRPELHLRLHNYHLGLTLRCYQGFIFSGPQGNFFGLSPRPMDGVHRLLQRFPGLDGVRLEMHEIASPTPERVTTAQVPDDLNGLVAESIPDLGEIEEVPEILLHLTAATHRLFLGAAPGKWAVVKTPEKIELLSGFAVAGLSLRTWQLEKSAN